MTRAPDKSSNRIKRRPFMAELLSRRGTALLIPGLGSPTWDCFAAGDAAENLYSWGGMGLAVPTALGVALSQPGRRVLCVTGDGGFMYNSQELSTAAREKINVVIVLFNDEAYGNVARDLDESWGGSHGAAVTNPDFMKLADAYGVVGLRATKPTEVGDLVRKAVTLDRPVLIEVRVGRMARPAFFAPMKAPSKYNKR